MASTMSVDFCLNTDHHGEDANSGIVFAFLRMCEDEGFEIADRSTTVTLRRNGHTVVMDRAVEKPHGTTVTFRLRGQTQPIRTVRMADLQAISRRYGRGRGEQQARLKAMRAALYDIVADLLLATI